jgi:hypothetical protein
MAGFKSERAAVFNLEKEGSMSMGMKPIRTAVAGAAVVLAGAASADAQSAKDWESANGLLAEVVATANAACGSTIVMKPVDPDPKFTAAEREHTVRGCRWAFEGIRLVCKTKVGRAAVSSQINRVGCAMSDERPAVALDRGTLEYRIDPGPAIATERFLAQEVFADLENLLQFDGQPLFVHALRPREEEWLASRIAQTNRSCGSSLTAMFDWTSVPAAGIKDGSSTNYCGHALDAVGLVCADRAGREAVAKQVKGIVCGYSEERSVSLKDGVLLFKSDYKSTEDRRTFIFEYLQNAL